MDGAALDALSGAIDAATLAFARVGACLTAMPALGSARISVRARLALALALAAALTPLVPPVVLPGSAPLLLVALGGEMAVGGALGLLARAHYAALRFAGSVIAASVGFQPLGGVAVEGAEPDGALPALLSLTAFTVLFAADAHHLVLRALLDTFDTWPPGGGLAPRAALTALTDALLVAFRTALSLAAPFLIYGLTVQMGLGLVNKLAPAVPLYFVGLPVLIGGGLVLLAVTAPEMLLVHLERLPMTLSGG